MNKSSNGIIGNRRSGRRTMTRMAAAAAALALGVAPALADTAYTYEDGRATLVATVSAGETNYLDSAKADELNGGTITKFRKLGDGRLVITNDTSSFTGHFWIEDGILTSRPITGVSLRGNDNLTMGKVPSSATEDEAGCGAIHVLSGATFSVDCRGVSSSVAENLRLQNKTTYFEGAGHNNLGALTILEGENNSAGPLGNHFGGYLRMTGAATIRNGINNWMGFSNNRYLYMGGHTLTLEGASAGIYEKLYEAYNFGDVVVKLPGISFNNYMWYGTSVTDSNHTMRVKSGAFLRLNDLSGDAYDGLGKAAYGTLHLENGAFVRLSASSRRNVMGPSSMADLNFPTVEYNDYRSNNNWMGPVVLDTPGFIKITGDAISGDNVWNGRYLQVGGKISGGGIALDRNVRLIMRKHIGAPDNFATDAYANDFTNGVFAASGADVTLEWGNLLPENGGDLVLSNASLTVRSGLTYRLPGIKCYGDCYFLGTMDNRYSPGYAWDPAIDDDLVRDTRQYYPALEFIRDGNDCSGNFSTNVIVSALSGLPEIAAYPADTDANPVRPCIATSTGPEYFKVIDTWTLDAAEAKYNGGCLSFPGGELRFGHENAHAAISVHVPDARRGEAFDIKVANAKALVFAGGKPTVTGDDGATWKLYLEDGDRSIVLRNRPVATTVVFR